MLIAVAGGLTHWTRLPLFYAVALGVLTLNQLRLLADHHFDAGGNALPSTPTFAIRATSRAAMGSPGCSFHSRSAITPCTICFRPSRTII